MLNQLTRTKDVFEVRQQHQIIKIKGAFYYRNLYWAFRILLLLIYGLRKYLALGISAQSWLHSNSEMWITRNCWGVCYLGNICFPE